MIYDYFNLDVTVALTRKSKIKGNEIAPIVW